MPVFANDVDDQMNVQAISPEWETQDDISQLYTGAPLEVKIELLFFVLKIFP